MTMTYRLGAVPLLLCLLAGPAWGASTDERDEMEAFHSMEEQLLSLRQEEALIRAARAMAPGDLWRRSIGRSLGVERGTWWLPPTGTISPPPGGGLPFPLAAVEFKYDIPVTVNEEVEAYLDFFQGPGRRWFTRWLERSHRWMPLFREILREYDLPEDLVFVAMIESGFSMHATSRARAVGPWQFMEATGRQYGLRIDFWVDERQDPVKSTHAAARFLRWLYQQHDDWYLAWAGYNGGPGRVRRAIDRHGSKDFWELARTEGAFHRETQHYVPKLIAAALIAKHPEHFGFTDLTPLAPLEWEYAELDAPTDLEVIARCAGVGVDAIRELNPELRQWATPPSLSANSNYRLRLPAGRAEAFAEAFAQVKPTQRFTFRTYRVQPGDTPGHIARMFGTSTAELMRSNRIKNARALRIGQELLIPIPPGALPRGQLPKAELSSTSRQRADASGQTHHVLRQGETLSHLAERYGASVEAIKRWNGIQDARKVRVGQRLRVR